MHDLVRQINKHHALAVRTAFSNAVRAGQLLAQAKAAVTSHGEWQPWVKNNCRFSLRTAQEYMRLAEVAATWDDEKRNAVAGLSLRELLRLTATPRTTTAPKAARIEGATLELAAMITKFLEPMVEDRDPQRAFDVLARVAGFLKRVNGKNLQREAADLRDHLAPRVPATPISRRTKAQTSEMEMAA